MAVANTLAYYVTATITAVKSFSTGPWGQGNSPFMPPNQKSKQSRVTILSLYKHWSMPKFFCLMLVNMGQRPRHIHFKILPESTVVAEWKNTRLIILRSRV